MKHFFKKRRKYIIGGIVIIFLGLWIFIANRSEESQYEFVSVEKGDIYQEVSVTGKVKAANSVELAFEKSGKVVSVNKDVGERVSKGTILIRTDASELSAQLREAEANIATQKAKLDELINKDGGQGFTKEYVGVLDLLNDSYTKAESAIRIKTASILTGSQDSGYAFSLSCNDSKRGDVAANRRSRGYDLSSWRAELNALDSDSSIAELNTALTIAKNNLLSFRKFMLEYVDLVNECWATHSIYSTTITDLNNGIASINTAITNITNKQQTILTQGSSISAQGAQVKQAEASADAIRIQISKAILRSPINGVVTLQDAKVGEIISANTIVATVISDKDLEIEANIPEADVAKIKVGNTTRITLDAYGSDVIFNAEIVKIDPAETVVEGVSTYKIVLQFTEEDERILPGMTANIDILTASRENVIVLSQRAVIRKDGGKIVRLLKGEEFEEVEVETGIRGSEGNIEILKGLQVGDKVITFIDE